MIQQGWHCSCRFDIDNMKHLFKQYEYNSKALESCHVSSQKNLNAIEVSAKRPCILRRVEELGVYFSIYMSNTETLICEIY